MGYASLLERGNHEEGLLVGEGVEVDQGSLFKVYKP